MAELAEIARILKDLAVAFPERIIDRSLVEIYAQDLADIPADVLQTAAEQIRRTQKFFPRISELRQAAENVQVEARHSHEPGIDRTLDRRQIILQDAFANGEDVDPDAWQELIDGFEAAGRPAAAAAARQRFQALWLDWQGEVTREAKYQEEVYAAV